MRLHLVVPAKGIGPRSWGKDFLIFASELGRDLSRIQSGEPLLYLPNAQGVFSNMPADTDRFASWVQDLLTTMPSYSGTKVLDIQPRPQPCRGWAKLGRTLTRSPC